MLIALILQVAGIGAEAIAADYAVSASGPTPMINTLNYLDECYGGASLHLRARGVEQHRLSRRRGQDEGEIASFHPACHPGRSARRGPHSTRNAHSTASSPRSDQSSWSTDWLTIFGVATR